MARTTKDKVIELKKLAAQAGANIYQRCKLATEVLSDEQYIVEVYRDELHAMEELETEFFRDVRGFMSLGRLRQLYLEYPREDTWAAMKYDLAALDAQYNEDHKPQGERAERRSYKQEAADLREELERVSADYRRAAAEAKELRELVAELNRQLNQLDREKATLEGRLSELERSLTRNGATTYAGTGA